ncbi:MAG: phosphoenolpyruvate synthase, partial [Candidatus Lokiarchaeota archaeon]|nr:phosphoenolpyruvate synthase [Candidatus Lokiarchaeota archaeon]
NFKVKSHELSDLILNNHISDSIKSEIITSLNKLDVNFVSIRSSAVSEDSSKTSFAGLHNTYLGINTNSRIFFKYIKKCWASLFNERALLYRLNKKAPLLEGMAVIVQEMIPSQFSGITFTTHPLNKDILFIEASFGIGNLIVNGEVEPDGYQIDRKTLKLLDKKIGAKNISSIFKNGKIKTIKKSKHETNSQLLSFDTVREISKTCLDIEKLFRKPQDIEWCIYRDKLWLLQSRAITEV